MGIELLPGSFVERVKGYVSVTIQYNQISESRLRGEIAGGFFISRVWGGLRGSSGFNIAVPFHSVTLSLQKTLLGGLDEIAQAASINKKYLLLRGRKNMNMHRRTTVGLKLYMLFIAACTLFISPALALAAEVDTLLNSSHATSWAYFRDPSQNAQSVWYISNPIGTTYGLGLNNSGHSSWVALANEGAVATLDFLNKKVSLNSSTATLTPTSSYLAISLVSGEANEYVYTNTAYQWANLIAGNTLNMEWYFFRVESTQTWYIVWINGTDSTILRLGLNAALNQYDWQKPLDASNVAVDTANWAKEFFQENGVWKVRFSTPNTLKSFQWPISIPAGATIDSPASSIYSYKAGFEHLESSVGYYVKCGDPSVYEPNADVNFHPGTDINVLGTSGNGDMGTPIFSIADGTVRDIYQGDGSIVIEHPVGNGSSVWANYRHNSNISVSIGSNVVKGQQIANMSNAIYAGTIFSHLHFEIRKPEHPERASASSWCVYGGKSAVELNNWLYEPLTFLQAHK